MNLRIIFHSSLQALVLTGLLLVTLMPVQATAKDVYTVGIVPQQAAGKLAKLWMPILSYIDVQTDFELVFKTAPSIPEFEQRLADGEYDIAYMNPYHYTIYSKDPGYKAFAKQKDKMIIGILVTRKDNNIFEPADLNQKLLAFPAPAAFAASILPRSFLQQAGVTFKPKYVSSHDSVYLSVAAGLYPAGGGIKRTLNNIDESIRNQLRILWHTKPYTPHAFAALSSVDSNHIQQLVKLFSAMGQNDQGKRLLENINFKGIDAAKDKDWDDVRALKIDLIQ